MEVILKYIKKDPWAGVTKYPGCANQLGSYWTRSGVRYTGLTEEKARELEKKLGYPEGHLSPYSQFWVTYAIKVPANGITLHTESTTHELQFEFLKNHKRVAYGTANIKPGHDYVMINANAEAELANKKNKVKREAVAESGKMSLNDMRKCLRLFGQKSDNISQELVESTLFDLIEKDPEKFSKIWTNNLNKETQFLIEEALAKNILRRQKHMYYYGTDVIGISLGEVIEFLDDKANQDLRLVIMQALESK